MSAELKDILSLVALIVVNAWGYRNIGRKVADLVPSVDSIRSTLETKVDLSVYSAAMTGIHEKKNALAQQVAVLENENGHLRERVRTLEGLIGERSK